MAFQFVYYARVWQLRLNTSNLTIRIKARLADELSKGRSGSTSFLETGDRLKPQFLYIRRHHCGMRSFATARRTRRSGHTLKTTRTRIMSGSRSSHYSTDSFRIGNSRKSETEGTKADRRIDFSIRFERSSKGNNGRARSADPGTLMAISSRHITARV